MNLAFSRFQPENAPAIASWLGDAAEARAWGGFGMPFPVDPQAFLTWRDDPDIEQVVAHHERELIAYGEVWRDGRAKEMELARIVVRRSHRRSGVGRALVDAMVQRAQSSGFADIFVRIMPENAAAVSCYQASGFRRLSADDEQQCNRGQPCAYVWMQYRPHAP